MDEWGGIGWNGRTTGKGRDGTEPTVQFLIIKPLNRVDLRSPLQFALAERSNQLGRWLWALSKSISATPAKKLA